jgi:hypothetical protein
MTRHGDSLLAERLSALEDPRDDSDWKDILRRALERPLESNRPFRGRRALLIAAAAATLVLVLGVALAATLGGFSGWLSGKPGSPASPTEQSAFQQANARSWAAFPSGTKLRRLIVKRVGGATYRLFGFRSGDELCLRLVAGGIKGGPYMSCVPRLELEQAKVPAVLVLVDASFGKAHVKHPARPDGFFNGVQDASASFGFVADNVSSVELEAGGKTEHAFMGGQAFLLVRRHVPFCSGVDRVFAIDTAGEKVAVPFGRSSCRIIPFSLKKPRYGPTRIDRKPLRRAIAWLDNHERRGLSLSQAGVPRHWLYGVHLGIHFARVIQPDPGNHVRVIIYLVGRRNAICTATITAARSGGGGCASLFDYPLAPSISLDQGGDQSALISGIASDAISRIDLFLNDGERWPVPFKDNAFVVLAPRVDLPAKLVGYDSQGKVVAIQDLTSL